MKIAFFGDSLTEAKTGVSYFDILKQKLPQYQLLNYGKGGDTVISLYRRISKIDFDSPFDITFTWIGTNDVLSKITSRFSIMKILKNQPPVKSKAEFKNYYQKLIDYLVPYSKNIITVTPLFIGENLDNQWNKELGALSAIIKSLSANYERITFLNLREILAARLTEKQVSDYHIRSITRVILDYLLLNTAEKVDRKAQSRGLHFTLDGVHLNSTGAEIVADTFFDAICRIKKISEKNFDNKV